MTTTRTKILMVIIFRTKIILGTSVDLIISNKISGTLIGSQK